MKRKIDIWIKGFSILSLAFLMTGCAQRYISKLKKTEPVGYEFSRALKAEYLDMATDEFKKYNDEMDSVFFSEKGILTAETGLEVLPENPYDWNISDDNKKAEIMKQRERLMFSLQKSGKIIAPKKAAKAQASFDYWIEEEEEGHQKDNINKCRETFMKNLIEVEKVVDKYAPTFKIYFGFDRSALTQESKELIEQVYNVMQHLNLHKLSIHCCADKVGSRLYNLNLTQKRAEVVKKAFMDLGLEEHRIDTPVGLGEVETSSKLRYRDRIAILRIH